MNTKSERFAAAYNDIERFNSLAAIAAHLGISEKRVRNKAGELRAQLAAGANVPVLISRKREAEKGRLGFDPVLPGFRLSRTAAERDHSGETVRSWVEQKPERGDVFELPAGQRIKGISALLDEADRTIVKWVKTGEDRGTDDLISALEQSFRSWDGYAPIIPAPAHTDDELLTVYPLPDLHIGMFATKEESGADFDLEIAATRLRSMSGDLINQSRPTRQALILGLGDQFHTNDFKDATPGHGHKLDVAGRYLDILMTGVQMIQDMIERALQKHESVLVRMLPGNHDPNSSDALTVALRLFYSRNPRVTVLMSKNEIFYHRFGKTLIGATHGHKMKPERMAMAMATDCPEDWGCTLHKVFFFGHIHHETVKEVGAVRCESFNTIAPKDAHASSSGYRSGQSLNALTFHRELGEIGRHKVNFH